MAKTNVLSTFYMSSPSVLVAPYEVDTIVCSSPFYRRNAE